MMDLCSWIHQLAALQLCLLLPAMIMNLPQALGLSWHDYGFFLGPPADREIGFCEDAAVHVTHFGYTCQEFEVTTVDGFILGVQRISRRGWVEDDLRQQRQPVLIQHGVLVDSMTWFLNDPKHNLPLILSDNGFDVWISNSRGTRYSRKHVYLDPMDSEYWDWTWDDLATYELPSIVDFVYSQTGQKIHYVGHSQGTLIALVSLSEGRMLDKMKSAALLSPVAYLSQMTTALGQFAVNAFLAEATRVFGVSEYHPQVDVVADYLIQVCKSPGINCGDMLSATTGVNCCLSASSVDLFIQNAPQSTSTKNMVHFSQIVRDGVVAKYDYVTDDLNLLHYGTPRPPAYNLSNIPRHFPLFLSYGGRDALSDPSDVKILLHHLQAHDTDKLITQFIDQYAHLDFIMGSNAKDVVYNVIIQFFNTH